MNILVINCGSSSVKYQIVEMQTQTLLVEGMVERIGEQNSLLSHTQHSPEKSSTIERQQAIANHQQAFEILSQVFLETNDGQDAIDLQAVGHRVVHGGAHFSQPALIDEQVLLKIRDVSHLAPLHNPANMAGITVCLKLFPALPQVAVFDTAFHQTMPALAYRYAVPQHWYTQHNVRRYGFHGTSHACVAKKAAQYMGKSLQDCHLISLHLGNGASACAIAAGISIDTSMGLTPLEGLIMGTRSGDIDPAIGFYMQTETQQSSHEIENQLNKQSGLKGVCGVNDMREVQRLAAEGDKDAQLAINMVCYRIKKYIGAYMAILNQVDAIIFTAGIGENSVAIRAQVCQDLQGLGIELDVPLNQASSGDVSEIQSPVSRVKILVINTNEELEIAQETLACIDSHAPSHL